jgi:hypothetical protein
MRSSPEASLIAFTQSLVREWAGDRPPDVLPLSDEAASVLAAAACGLRRRVGRGVFDGGGDGQEGVGEHGQGDVPVPAVVAADLILVETDFVLR